MFSSVNRRGLVVVSIGVGIALILLLVLFSTGLIMGKTSGAVPMQPVAPYMYVAKFVCVGEVGPAGFAVQAGNYRTVVNIHNPNSIPVEFSKKAVIANRELQPRGRISEFFREQLLPDEALSVDCDDLTTNFFPGADPVGDGFVVILSPYVLDVVAVYTARKENTVFDTVPDPDQASGKGIGLSIDVEYIKPTEGVQ